MMSVCCQSNSLTDTHTKRKQKERKQSESQKAVSIINTLKVSQAFTIRFVVKEKSGY